MKIPRVASMMRSVGAGVLSFSLCLGCGPSGPLQVPLHYGPTSALSLGALSGPVAAATFRLGEIKDARAARPEQIGESREESEPVGVYAPVGSVVDTTRQAFERVFTSAGLRLSTTEGIVLNVDVLELWVVEEGIYKGTVRLRVSVVRDGQYPQVIIVDGTSKRWGSSLNPDNYVEIVSDALVHTLERLLALPEFEAAVGGLSQ